MEDVEVTGQQIEKGDKVILQYHTVNHDEIIFGEDSMKFDVTRTERMRNPKFADEIEYTRSNLVNGIKSMSITFDPEVKQRVT